MSRKSSKRVSFSPDLNDNPAIFLKHKYGGSSYGKTNSSGGRIWAFRLFTRDMQLSGPVQFLRQLGGRTARVLRLIGNGKSSRNSKVSSPSANLVRSRSMADQSESHRAQAIEDCIEFLNSYSSLQRSSSVSSAC